MGEVGGKLSVGGAALEGVRLIGRQPLAVLAWALAVFLLAVLPSVGVAWLMARGGAPHETLIQSAGLLTDALPWVSLPAWAVLYGAIYRAVMAPEQRSFSFLRLSLAELRQFLLLIIRIALFLALLIGGSYLAGFAFGVGRGLASPFGVAVQIVGPLCVLALCVWVWLRLSMAAPMSFAQARLRFFASWSFTRKRVLTLFALMLVAGLMTLLAEFVAAITLFGLVDVAAGMLRWKSDQVTAALMRPLDVTAAPYLLALGLAYSVVCVLVQCVALAPWARAYQVLAGVGVQSRVEAPPGIANKPVFGPLPAGARLGPVWSAPIILVLAISLAMGLLTVGMLIVLALARLGGLGFDAKDMNGWLAELAMSVVFDLLAVALLVIWARTAERRSLASIGLGGGFQIGDLAWFAVGATWAFVLALGLGLAAQVVSAAIVQPQASLAAFTLPPESMVQAPAVLVVIILLAFSEEVMFRGWLMSAIAPRAGVPVAISISSLLFAAFHVLPWELGDPARLVSFLSYAAIGAGFAAVALGRGQIWSSTALHAGYNSFLAFATMASQHATPQKLWGAVSLEKRGSTDADQAWMTLGLNLAIGAVLVGLLIWARRGKTPATLAVAAAG